MCEKYVDMGSDLLLAGGLAMGLAFGVGSGAGPFLTGGEATGLVAGASTADGVPYAIDVLGFMATTLNTTMQHPSISRAKNQYMLNSPTTSGMAV
jgi:hypothetical protein